MDARDWITAGSFLASLAALGISGWSLRLAWTRDQRELEAKQPAIDIDVPACLGPGPWTAMCQITNRSADTIVLEAILANATHALVIRTDLGGSAEGREPQKRGLDIILRGIMFEREIKPGETISEPVPLKLFGRDRQLAGNTPIDFYVDLRARNERQRRERRKISRVARI